jgi:hypothetical protein
MCKNIIFYFLFLKSKGAMRERGVSSIFPAFSPKPKFTLSLSNLKKKNSAKRAFFWLQREVKKKKNKPRAPK